MAGGKKPWAVVLGVLIALSMAQQRVIAQQGEAYARVEGGQCTIGNGAVERTIRLADPVQTTLIKNKIAGKEIALQSSEFALKMFLPHRPAGRPALRPAVRPADAAKQQGEAAWSLNPVRTSPESVGIARSCP